MMKNYKLSLLMVLTTFVMSALQAQTATVTIRVDMNNETVNANGVNIASTFETLNPSLDTDGNDFTGHLGASKISLTDGDSDGIYEITMTVNDDTYNRYAIYNGVGWSNNAPIPRGCQADLTYVQYEHYFEAGTNTTILYEYGQCAKSEWNGVGWDIQDPIEDGHLIFKEDYTLTTGEMTAGIIEVADEKNATIAAGASLTVFGEGHLGEGVANVIVSEDFESGIIPDAVDEDGEILTIEDGYETNTTKVLKIFANDDPDTDASDNRSYFDFTITDAGTYRFSFDANTVGFDYIRLETSGGAAIEPNVSLAPGDGWVAFSFDIAVDAGDYHLRMQTGNNPNTLYIDNFVIQTIPEDFGDLEVVSGASLLTTEDFDEEVTISRTTSFADGKYSFVGTPVEQSASISGSDLGSNVYKYQESVGYDSDAGLSRWVSASADQLVPGIGYTQSNQEVITFTGIPNAGDITVSGLSLTTTGTANAGNRGWHMLSNPYPAAIDLSKFIAANTDISGSISIWEDGGSDTGRRTNADYLTANAIATVNGVNKNFEGYIGAMQGFFVQAMSDGVNVVFNDSMKVSGNNADINFFRKSEEVTPGIKLVLRDNENSSENELYVGLLSDATVGMDRKYDAPKLKGAQSLQFYSLIDDSPFAIQGLPLIDGIAQELAFDLQHNSKLEISASSITGLEEGKFFYLVDNVTKEEYNLSSVTTIAFEAEAGTDQNRFTLVYKAEEVLSVKSSGAQPVYRYIDNNLIVDFNSQVEIMSYAVYDMSGRLLSSESSTHSSDNIIIPITQSGVNIIKVSTSEGLFSRKFIF